MKENFIRSIAREYALRILFQSDFETISDETIEYVLESDNFKEAKIDEVKAFCRILVYGVLENRYEIDELIKKTLVNWKFERVSVIDKSLLRLGIFEIVKIKESPKTVVISEIIKLSQKYSEKDSYKFLNGILDRFQKNTDLKNSLK